MGPSIPSLANERRRADFLERGLSERGCGHWGGGGQRASAIAVAQGAV